MSLIDKIRILSYYLWVNRSFGDTYPTVFQGKRYRIIKTHSRTITIDLYFDETVKRNRKSTLLMDRDLLILDSAQID
ncbi:hypothetical protein J8281_17225 [Aquimarina sp. U1-2]|nr:hypothetical protein [Aquimarina sp. U1-2]